MKRTDNEIHHIELLLTLDYLLNKTDKEHPATQQDICRHATNYGLKYDSKANTGNDVRRQRIGDCLQFLEKLSNMLEDKFPFSIKTTNSGKFYLEKKNGLTEEQIIKILAAIKNDKYTRDEDTNFLIEKLLDTFSNCYNRDYFKTELNKAIKNVNKYNFQTNRKIRLVSKALKENKTIVIRRQSFTPISHIELEFSDSNYRVYKIKEYENKLYAILLRVSISTADKSPRMIFDAIENLNIPAGPDNKVLAEDFDENRDLNKLYAEQYRYNFHYFKNIDNMIDANVRPEGGFAFVISFYFFLSHEDIIKQSFENFFSQPLEYTKCSSFETLKERNYGTAIKLPCKTDKGILVPRELKENQKPFYGVANVSLNAKAFKEWVCSNYSDNKSISEIIKIAGPTFIKEDIAYYYYTNLSRYLDNLSEKNKEKLLSKLNKNIK